MPTEIVKKSDLREECWQQWWDEMTGEQGLGYYNDMKDELRGAFDAGWEYRDEYIGI